MAIPTNSGSMAGMNRDIYRVTWTRTDWATNGGLAVAEQNSSLFAPSAAAAIQLMRSRHLGVIDAHGYSATRVARGDASKAARRS